MELMESIAPNLGLAGEGNEPEEKVVEIKDRPEMEQYVVDCRDLSIDIGKTSILQGIEATFVPDQITALMGPSGSGKTTLMNALSARGQGKISSGQVLINGEQKSKEFVRKVSALVPQMDILFPVLTCRETFYYAASLALKSTTEERDARVDELMNELSLHSCADVLVGDEDVKGLSGGERKRVSIGIELLSNPSLLFLDEPTSGLDAKIARDVVELLRSLAQQGRTIVCTIHQPSFQLFSCFDNLVLLNKGQMAYNGPVHGVSNYFESINFPVAEFTNPADHMLEVLGSDSSDTPFATMFLDSTYYDAAKRKMESARELASSWDSDSEDVSESTSMAFLSAWVNQFVVVFRRSARITLKDKQQARQRFVQVSIVAFILGVLYFDLANTQATIFDRQSILFITVFFNVLGSIVRTAVILPLEKAVVKREYNNGYYGVFSFFIARTCVLYCFQTFYTLATVALVYPLVNFVPIAENVGVFTFTLFILGNIAISLGYLTGSLVADVQTVVLVIPSVIIPLVFFSGLFIAPQNIPDYFIWIYHLNFVQYAYTVVLINEFKDRNFEPCSLDDLQNFRCPLGQCLSVHGNQTLDATDPRCLQNSSISFDAESCSGLLFLTSQGFEVDQRDFGLGMLLLFWALVLVAGAFVLRRFLKKS